jgi:hypothetical protein
MKEEHGKKNTGHTDFRGPPVARPIPAVRPAELFVVRMGEFSGGLSTLLS